MDTVSPISDANADAPVIASYGAGTNSAAMLIEMVRRGERLDAILFADAGGERPATYAYVRLFSAWLRSQGAPAIQTVRKGGRPETLEQNCLRMHMLPSVAYGHKSCSLKYKDEPQERWGQPLATRTGGLGQGAARHQVPGLRCRRGAPGALRRGPQVPLALPTDRVGPRA